MRRYLEHAILIDLVICIFVVLGLYYGKPIINRWVHLRGSQSMKELGDALITVSATLIGFLLTIITVIVTFKKGFEDKVDNQGINASSNLNDNTAYAEPPKVSVFEKKITKEEQFYNSQIHKKVANVFMSSTYETGVVLFLLLGMKIYIVELSTTVISILIISALISITLSAIRSFYIFKLFLRVHLHDEK